MQRMQDSENNNCDFISSAEYAKAFVRSRDRKLLTKQCEYRVLSISVCVPVWYTKKTADVRRNCCVLCVLGAHCGRNAALHQTGERPIISF